MGLLDKLEQVEIKADSRLPEDDLMFCETQQQAYDESCRALREIRQQWKKAIQAQRDLLGIGQDGSLPYFGSNYRFGITDLNRELEKFHSRFISELTQHFNEKYNLLFITATIVAGELAEIECADSKKAPPWNHSQDGAFLLWIRVNTSRRNRR